MRPVFGEYYIHGFNIAFPASVATPTGSSPSVIPALGIHDFAGRLVGDVLRGKVANDGPCDHASFLLCGVRGLNVGLYGCPLHPPLLRRVLFLALPGSPLLPILRCALFLQSFASISAVLSAALAVRIAASSIKSLCCSSVSIPPSARSACAALISAMHLASIPVHRRLAGTGRLTKLWIP